MTLSAAPAHGASSSKLCFNGLPSVREFSKSSSLVLFGLNPPYSFVVVAIPVVASLSALSYGRLRRQATPSRPEGEFADFSRLSQCKNCNGYNIPGASACRHCGARLS